MLRIFSRIIPSEHSVIKNRRIVGCDNPNLKALFPGTPAQTEINNHFISHGIFFADKVTCASGCVYVVSSLDKDQRRFNLQKKEKEMAQ